MKQTGLDMNWLTVVSIAFIAIPTCAPASGQTSTGRLGVYLSLFLSPAELNAYGVVGGGAVVTGIFPDTEAEKDGWLPGDAIQQIDGRAIKTSNDANEAIGSRKAGDIIEVVRSRRGEVARIQLRLSPLPENPNVELFKLAQSGQPWAQAAIAYLYRWGKGTKTDHVKARYWFQKAADAGVSIAHVDLSEMHENGEGGPVDLGLALQEMEKVAKMGYPNAQQSVGRRYWLGRGCARDVNAAFHWWELSARAGNPDGQFSLAGMYLDGTGVAQNFEEAAKWYTKAAEAGHHEAMGKLGNFYARGTGVPKDFGTALRWLTPAAEAGVPSAQNDLGAIYYEGLGVAPDHATAAKWFHSAAIQGNVSSQTSLGMIYWRAEPPDYEKAFHWLSIASDHGNAQSWNALGQMYRNGWGVGKDEAKAFEFQKKAADTGDVNARYNMGVYYADGVIVPVNYTEALRWVLPIANDPAVQPKSQFLIGTIYSIGGSGVGKNLDEAFKWYGVAAQGGHIEAQRLYGQMLRARDRHEESVKWLRAAAEKNDRAAQNDLGTAYIMGRGVPQSRTDGIAWLLRAYRQGSQTAKESLRKLGVDAK